MKITFMGLGKTVFARNKWGPYVHLRFVRRDCVRAISTRND